MQQAHINIDLSTVLRSGPRATLGINVNFLLDHDGQRKEDSAPLAIALRQMGTKWLRYPGGDKSDGYLWSCPPYSRPEPVPAIRDSTEWPYGDTGFVSDNRFVRPTMDFDGFMELCNETGAEPVVVLCYDCAYSGDSNARVPTLDTLLETAVEWVRYSNTIKKYGVRYWELGNESYLKGRNNELGVRARDYARDAAVFSSAMKAVDPTIKFGINGPESKDGIGSRDTDEGCGDIWWKKVLQSSAEHIDYLSVHSYPCFQWMDYDAFLGHDSKGLSRAAREAEAAITEWCTAQDAERMEILLTEINSADWYGHPQQCGWPHHSSLGHALVLFDMLGENMLIQRMTGQMVWNTRWLKESGNEIWDALDEDNTLLPTGQALQLWSDFCNVRLACIGESDNIKVYVCTGGADISIYVLNRGYDAARIDLDAGQDIQATGKLVLWSGKGQEDEHPVVRETDIVNMHGGKLDLFLPPVSLTVAVLSQVGSPGICEERR